MLGERAEVEDPTLGNKDALVEELPEDREVKAFGQRFMEVGGSTLKEFEEQRLAYREDSNPIHDVPTDRFRDIPNCRV